MIANAALAAGWFKGLECQVFGAGHINDTYVVRDAAGVRFVLQRINPRVFRDPSLVLRNVVRIVEYLGVKAPGFVAALVPSRGDEPGLYTADGEFWRLWRYVENTRVCPVVKTLQMARAAGAAFGRFQQLMAGMPGDPLAPVIPGFLELQAYLTHFDDVVLAHGVTSAETPCSEFIAARRDLTRYFPPGECYIHGDCKLNNLLFNQTREEVVCVVDLDTVMRGHWAWDFGDLARSALSETTIDEVAVFAALAGGFLATSRVGASVEELVMAPRYVAFMLGVRFLSDHLAGDEYFKVEHRGDNLLRARQQFTLVELLESLEEKLQRVAAPLVAQAG